MKRIWLVVLLLLFLPAAAAGADFFLKGDQGPQGDQGTKGLTGDKGVTGDTGIKGLTGDQGQKGPTGDPGTSVTSSSISPGGVCSTATGVKYTSVSGETNICDGVKGDQGQQGLQGLKGDKGITGDTGPKGLTGDQGPKGLTGDQGAQGDSFFTCTGGSCSTSNNLAMANLVVTDLYDLPDCPQGYTKDARTDIVLCTRGSDQMVKVGDFWIDRYEGIIVNDIYWNNGTCDGAGTQYGDTDDWAALNTSGEFKFTGDWTKKLYACSKSSVTPSAFMTWFQAQEACVLSGKRLCTNEEWQAAAAGTMDPGAWPDMDGNCNASIQSGKCNTCSGGARNTGNAGSVPGGATSCISSWGAEDMIGNEWEFVSMWGQGGPDNGVTNGLYQGATSGTTGFSGFSPETTGDGDGTWNLAGAAYGCDRNGSSCGWHVGLPSIAERGGRWNSSNQAGVFAISLNHGPSNRDGGTSFRCCMRR